MAENEVAHAGIGVDVGVNGLDKLIKTNDVLKDVRQTADHIHDITSNITTHVENGSEVQHLKNELDQIRHEYKINLDVDTNGAERTRSVISSINDNTRRLQSSLKSVGNDSSSSFNKFDDNANKAREKTSSLSDEGKKIHGVFSGTFLGNAASQAFSAISSGAKSAVTSGIKLVSTSRDTERAWKNIGTGNQGAQEMTKQMADIRDKAGLDEQSINLMQKSFYSLTGSAPKAQSLTNELVSFGKASGESDQALTRMGRTLPRMLSTGKVSGQMFNRTFRQSPELINAIAKASGHTTGQFRQLASNGKITSQQLMQYMQKAAKGSGHAWAQYAQTFQGQVNVIKGTWTKAKENFSRPFVSNLSKVISQTTKSNGGLLKVQKTVGKISTALGKKVGNFIGKAIGWIIKNQKSLFRTGNALFRIIKAIHSGVWKEFVSILTSITGGSNKSGKSLRSFSLALSKIADHTTALRRLGRTFAAIFIITKINKAVRSVDNFRKSFGKLAIVGRIKNMMHAYNATVTAEKITASTAGTTTSGFSLSIRGIGAALRSVPLIGWIQLAIDGFTLLYTHCKWFRKLISLMLSGLKHFVEYAWRGFKMLAGIVFKFDMAILKVIKHILKITGISKIIHKATGVVGSFFGKTGHWISNTSHKFIHGQKANASSVKRAHSSIDAYRRNSSGKFRAYIAKNGKIYKHYHAGTTRISETTYKQREALRRRYYTRYESSLKKYEANYKKYESKRSSLSRRYGKLRAMYSEKSLKTIENRFKGLRNTVVRYAKMMFRDTQRIFKQLGNGAIKSFRNIYNAVRKYMRMSIREDTRDFKQLYRINRRYLDGSVKKYIEQLRYRYKRQRYYDNQLVKQAKATAKSMYHLPLGWITRETKDLIRNWQHQRRSYVTHNRRMSHSELTHLHTMTTHLNHFGNNFRKLMDDLEDNIYSKWVKFWDKMHNATGHGINAVQSPLNSGAEHINSFVRAFGEDTSPMHQMPEVSYATGTGFRRPITKMVNATLNDGHDSPETGEQETVMHPNGSVEFPQGQNVQETLEPGTEVLNATETKLLGQMAHFAPTVHFSTGTGLFGGLFDKMSGWIKSAIEGNNNGMDYSSIYSQAKGSGYHKLLHVLQKVLNHSTQVLAGFMGNAPHGFNGALSDITKGIYGQTSSQINSWWQALMNLTNQALNNGGSSSALLNYAMKNFSGIPYSMGGESHAAADCSGAVDMIARHFGVDLPRTTTGMENDSSQLQYEGKDESHARAGDLVLFGHGNGAAGHVGIYTGHPDLMWNETPPRSRVSKISDAQSVVSLAGFYRLKKLANSNSDQLSFKGANKGLMGFVKKQEAPMFKWIQKHLAPLLNPDPGGGPGVAKWRPIIEDAAKAMHVHLTQAGLDKVLSNIRHESGGDEKVTQHVSDINSAEGDPAKGLVQFIPPTFRHYAVSGHDNILNGYDQLLALFNDSNWFSDIAPGGGWGPSGSRRMQAGGHINRGELATVGEAGEELFKPDTSGTIIPHSTTKKIMNNNSQKPITIHQNITFNGVSGNRTSLKRTVQTAVNKSNDNLMQKLNRLGGNTDGGVLV